MNIRYVLSLFALALLFVTNEIQAQDCQTDTLLISTQEQIDDFSIDYAACVHFDGTIIIEGEAIQNLNGLNILTSIQVDLIISNCEYLPNLLGLEGLVEVGGKVDLFNLDSLMDLSGLDNLTTIGDKLKVRSSAQLENLNGLNQLTSIGKGLKVGYNKDLTSLSGLDNLAEIGNYLVLEHCESLNDLTALQSLTSLGGDLRIDNNVSLVSLSGLDNISFDLNQDKTITNNLLLSECEINSLCSLLILGDNNITINNNGETCNSLDTLYPICNVFSCEATFATLNSQEDVDNFPEIYGEGCNQILNSLRIEGSNIQNLDGLNSLEYVGELIIENCPSLTNLQGLNNLKLIERNLEIYSNSSLVSLQGLENLETINSNLIIKINHIQSLNGLQGLVEVGGNLEITWNDNLQDLSGLNNLEEVEGSIYLSNNDGLVALQGLNSLEKIGKSLYLKFLENLENLDDLESLLHLNGGVTIQQCDLLSDISTLSILPTVNGDLSVSGSPLLADLSVFSNVEKVNGIFLISSASFTDTDVFSNLTTIEGDAFLIGLDIPDLSSFGNLHTVNGDLVLRYTKMTSFNGLDNLTNIGRSLKIEHNNSLQSLAGLNSLDSIGNSLKIKANNSLSNLTGLDNLVFVEQEISVKECNSLTHLTGLGNITHIEKDLDIVDNSSLINFDGLNNLEYIGGSLKLYNNGGLTNLYGLNQLKTIMGGLSIVNNDLLLNIDDLVALDYVGGVSIRYNNLLSSCSIDYFCNYIDNGNSLNHVSLNNTGCNSVEEIIDHCNFDYNLVVPVFYDLNQNGLYENNEPLYPGSSVMVNPGEYQLFTTANFPGRKNLDYGDYTLSYLDTPNTLWELTAGSSEYAFTLDDDNPSDTLIFGVYPSSIESEYNTIITSSLIRCNEIVLFDVFGENNGSAIADGTLWLQIDENITNITFIDEPDTIASGILFGWHFEDLYPGHTINKEVLMTIPGPPDFPIGEELHFSTYLRYTDENGSGEIPKFLYSTPVQCAYDPNDKLVNPVYPEKYALMGEDLVYTIRFQNTGNAEAYHVVIQDALDDHLDPTTFKLIASSHESVLSAFIESNKYLTFEFRDIFLPDSTTNFDDSQGYVSYRIRTLEGIDEMTPIENTAAIYFDFNPPVITNTTENIMLSTFDFDEDGSLIWEDCNDYNPNVHPDLEEISYNGLDDDCNPLTLEDDLDQDGFSIVVDCDDENPFINVFATEIPNNGIDEDCDGEDLITTNLIAIEHQIKIYPNPTNGNIHLLSNHPDHGSLKLFNCHGQEIGQYQYQETLTIDLSPFPAGIYLLQVKLTKEVFTQRIIKL